MPGASLSETQPAGNGPGQLSSSRCRSEPRPHMSGAAAGVTHDNWGVPLYLTEADVAALLTPHEAIEAVEGSLRRLASGLVDNRPRERLPLENGQYAAMA